MRSIAVLVAVSNKLARSLFGDQDPIGQVVRVADRYDLQVKAVFEDIQRGSSMRFEYIMPIDIYQQQRGNGWNWGNYDHPLYLKLGEGASAGGGYREDQQDGRG